MPYGGDYNPEQFDEDVWQEDMRLFRLAHIDIVTLNVFSWAALQPSENTYDFEKLDKIMNLVRENRLKVCMATSTGAHPAWMAKRHPDILRVDFEGRKRKFGGRHNSCPNSPTYIKYAPLLAGKLAERYKDYDNIVAWHISNEYGGECYCENCESNFRLWLKNKYGSIKELNRSWNTSFWGHTFYDWDEIVAPNMLSEHFDYDRTTFQGISLDYRRFMSDSILNCYKLEHDVIKKITPDIPITTNFMGLYKPLDYRKWASSLDFISWDNYPDPSEPYTITAMKHDTMRGLKDGQSFALMEQTPSVTNWLNYNALKRPGIMRLWSYQAVAHGSDSVMFFQMRRSIGACEKYHGAIIDHAGSENTRVFREATELGRELDTIGDELLSTKTNSKAAIYFDWSNWWAIEYSAGPSIDLKYVDEVHKYYKAFNKLGISVDIIFTDTDFSKYDLIVAPVLYMVPDKLSQKIHDFTNAGGIFITTFFSGYVNENDLVYQGGYPGPLRDVLGIWVEEEDALPPDKNNSFVYNGKEYKASLLCDLLHTEGATALAFYQSDFYAGMPVITHNVYGKGDAYYVAASCDDSFCMDFIKELAAKCNAYPLLQPQDSSDLEITVRENDSYRYIFILNHSDSDQKFTLSTSGTDILNGNVINSGLSCSISSKDVKIIKQLKEI